MLQTVKQGTALQAKYEYGYVGGKLRVTGSDGKGYAYLGSLVYICTGSSYIFESGSFGEGTVNNSGICYHLKDHLGSIRAVIDGNAVLLEENDYYAFGQRQPRSGHAQLSANRFKYNGKELQTVGSLGFIDYGARMYDATLGRWFNTDPLSEKYYAMSPYNYCGNSPIRHIDPDGRDPIYGKNFWGKIKLIGDDGKENGQSYLVSNTVKREVKQATKAGENYSGSLAESGSVFKIPTNGIMDDVINSVATTKTSQKENGGHANFGDINATPWDEGPTAVPFVDKDGNPGAKASLAMFKIGGKNKMPLDASNVEFWWHTHPHITVNKLELGNSNPSEADFRGQTTMINRGFKGNTFVIGVKSHTVTFFNGKKVLITIKYSDFKIMGGK